MKTIPNNFFKSNFLYLFMLYYNSLSRHCSGFDVFLAGINKKLGINNIYAW